MNPLQRAWSYKPFRWGAIIAGLTAGTLLLLPGLHIGGYSANQFLPHATCYLRDPGVIWLNVISDTFIAAAYLSISGTLGYIVYRARHDIPFHWMFAAFGLFIVACGFTHIMGVVTVWRPYYWLAGDVKAITAVASMATAVILPFTVPRVFSMIHEAKLSEERKLQIIEANEKLRAADELKSQFFANVSHELRTPLSLILGPLRRQLASEGITPELRAELEVAERNAGLLLQQVNNLLDLAKLDAEGMTVNYEEVDVAELARLVASYFDTLAAERGMAFELDVPQEHRVQADRDKTLRVCLNLLSNAFKFTPDAGTVRCAVRTLEDEVEIVVEDSGPGIPEVMRAEIFERFQQVEGGASRRAGGTGLGLAIVKEFVGLHGGTIKVDDAPIGGARFTVRLPNRAPEGAEVAEPAPAADIEVAGPVISELRTYRWQEVAEAPLPVDADSRPLVLVVEDNPDMSSFIASILHERYRVAIAHDGRQGLEQARRLLPDLIVSDVMMPNMSGDEMIAALRADDDLREIPVVVLTAKADERQRVELLEEGAQDHLTKPFRPDELQARVEGLIQRRQETIRKLREVNASLEERVTERTAEVERQAEQLRLLASELSTIEQRERRRLAQALHDHLQQLLVTAKFSLEQASMTAEPDPVALERVRDALDQALQSSRDVTFDLYPPILYERGLTAGLEWLARRARDRHGLEVHVSTERGADPDDQDLQAFLFAAVQELLLNVRKHSDSSHASVELKRAGDRVILTVEDGGSTPGIEAMTRASRSEGFGLFSIRERLRVLGGTMSIEPREAGGCLVRIECPAA